MTCYCLSLGRCYDGVRYSYPKSNLGVLTPLTDVRNCFLLWHPVMSMFQLQVYTLNSTISKSSLRFAYPSGFRSTMETIFAVFKPKTKPKHSAEIGFTIAAYGKYKHQ